MFVLINVIMRKCMGLLLVAFAFISVGYGRQANEEVLKKISNEVLRNSGAYENLRYLSKKIGPRLSGSVNAQKSVMATADMLSAAGADTVYLQPCMVPHWERGARETGYIRTVAGSTYPLNLCALGNSVGTGAKGITAKVEEVKSMDELHRLGPEAIRGNIIFFNIPMNPDYVRTFKAYGEAGIGRRVGPAQAAKYGAIGVIVRSLASNIDNFPHTGVTQYNDSFPKIPAVAISTKDAEWLSNQLRNDVSVKAYFKTSCRMLPDVASFNVIGEIKGIEYPGEIITVGGHLDSWDLGEGAQDDGAGCVQSIEVLRALRKAGIRPKRTIRAVMFMNEENGGAGGRAYLQWAKDKKEKHVFALESDAGGFTPRGISMDMPVDKREILSRWKPYFYEYGVYDFSPGGGGSDIAPLKELGVPLAGFAPDSQRYFDLHHAANDVFEAVSKRELDLGAANMAMLIWLVSEYGL